MEGGDHLRKGPWHHEEDERLKAFVAILGERRWDSIARATGLRRSGKSCRLRWLNYLKPCLKQGPITPDEERLIFKLHEKWGNKWAKIARRLQGRTDNTIKNFWRSHLRKKMQMQKALHYSTIKINNNNSSLETSTSSDQPKNSNQDVLGDTITKKISSNHNEEAFADLYCDINPKGFLDTMITNIPFENEVSDWTNMLSSNEPSYNELSPSSWESRGSQLCYDHLNWSLEDCSAWNYYPQSLWDTDC